jgi:hypothetical protein
MADLRSPRLPKTGGADGGPRPAPPEFADIFNAVDRD